tara:strand:- start:290 stop:457 length:168 start_codon:yes stop_codon:yes gene_type:complete
MKLWNEGLNLKRRKASKKEPFRNSATPNCIHKNVLPTFGLSLFASTLKGMIKSLL